MYLSSLSTYYADMSLLHSTVYLQERLFMHIQRRVLATVSTLSNRWRQTAIV